MQLLKTNFAKNVVAFGLTTALTLGGVSALTSAPLVENAYGIETAAATSIEAATTFTFSDSGIEATGATDGYKVSGTDLTIQAAGTYRITGSCADGTIAVKKEVEGVTLVLDNLTLAKDGDKAIKFKAGSSGTIVLVGENTVSTANDKGIIKANAVEDENENLVYASDGSTTGGDLVITGEGTLNLSSDYQAVVDGETEDCDAINCEGDLTVLGGTFNIAVTDDGMHSDNTLTIGVEGTAGPTINITKATEGLEGASVNLLSGTGQIVTNDDGVNAANSDLVNYGWQYGINVAGGTWKVVAGGDGLDSNGNLTIAGGSTEVYCTGNGNGALDYGEGMEGEIRGAFTISGGSLFAVGSDMMVAPSSGNYVMFGGQGASMAMGGMQPGQTGQGAQSAQMGQSGQMGQMQAQSALDTQAAPGQQASGAIVTKGEKVIISSGSKTLFETTAAASGSYALFASEDLGSNDQVTMKSGSTTTSAAVGSAQGAQPGQAGQAGQSGQPGQMPGQQGQAPDMGQAPDDFGSMGQPPAGQAPAGQAPADMGQTPGQPGQAPDDFMPAGQAQQPAQQQAQQSSQAEKSQQQQKAKTANTMKVKSTAKTVKAKNVKKSAKKVKALNVTSAKGKVTYSKTSGSKYLTINKSNGKVTVKKGTPKGVYKAKVKVKAAGDSTHKAATKTVTVKVKVK